MNQTAAVLLHTSDGKLIMQLRDDKPGIDYPGYLTLFGGLCRAGESPKAGAIREIREELGLELDESKLSLWRHYDKPAERDGSPARLHIFSYGAHVDPAVLVVREGQGYQLVGSEDDLDLVKITKLARSFIPEYLVTLQKKQPI